MRTHPLSLTVALCCLLALPESGSLAVKNGSGARRFRPMALSVAVHKQGRRRYSAN